MTTSVTKKELINAVSVSLGEQGTELSKADIEKVVGAYTDAVMGSLVHGQRVQLGKLGSLTPVLKAARTARNPKTGEEIAVPEKAAIKFSQSKAFGELLNSDEAPTLELLKAE